MRKIKLSGREASVIRSIGFAVPVLGSELQEITQLHLDDLIDVINALISAGYVESVPYTENVDATTVLTNEFEVNSAYAHELKECLHMGRRRAR